jgi:hypothetical protein
LQGPSLRLHAKLRACDPRKKHALHAASPSSNASTRGDSESGWPKKPRRKVCFLFDALMQSKDLERDAKHLVTLRRATHNAIHPSHTHIGPLEGQSTIVHGSYCGYPSHFCCPLQGGHDARDVSTSIFPSTSEGFAAISPPTLTKTSHSAYLSLLKFSPLSTCPSLPSASLSPRDLIKDQHRVWGRC